jgi:hypothetical protein
MVLKIDKAQDFLEMEFEENNLLSITATSKVIFLFHSVTV